MLNHLSKIQKTASAAKDNNTILYTTATHPVNDMVRIVVCDETEEIIVDKTLEDVTHNIGELTSIHEALVYAAGAQEIRLYTTSKAAKAWLGGEVVSGKVTDRPAIIELISQIKTLGEGVNRTIGRVPRSRNLAIEAIAKSKPKAVYSPGCDPPWQGGPRWVVGTQK